MCDVDQAIQTLAADSGTLLRITGVRSGAGYALIDLIFGRGTLRLTCDADTDEIVVSAIGGNLPGDESALVENDSALASLIGKTIEQVWMMFNSRGYADAFQVRCLDLTTRAESCCQFEVAAAAISVALVGV